MKRKLFLMLVCGLLSISAYCQEEKGFVINGEIANAKDGVKVWLFDDLSWPNVKGDSSVIKDGKFQLKGHVNVPLQIKVVMDPDPSKDIMENPYRMLATALYLENSVISFKGDANTMTTYYYNPESTEKKVEAVVTGSKENDIYQRYKKEETPLREEYRAVNAEYYKVYSAPAFEKHVFNIDEGIPLAKKMTEIDKKIQSLQLKYVREYPSTSMAYDLLMWSVYNCISINLTEKQLNQLEDLIVKNNPKRAEEVKAIVALAKNSAIGNKYLDLELLNTDGKTVKLSEYMPKGKYVLLEFWDSGCAPCRGEIPHVKHVYELYKNKDFDIVSISIDLKSEPWLNALNKENMPWNQLRGKVAMGDGRFVGEVMDKFNITGVPKCVLLDKEGRFFKTDVRGCNLDIVLRELFGNPEKK